MGKITVVGLGPGSFGLLTLEAHETMKNAAKLILRTAKHPTADELTKRGISFSSYDDYYDEASDFSSLYEKITADLIEKSRKTDIVYAVPGSPLVAEKTVALLREKAQSGEIELKITAGMSFLEVLYTSLGIDPIDGVTIVEAEDLARLPFDLPTGLVVVQVYNRAVASEAKLALMEYLPDDYEVVFVRNLGLPDEVIKKIPLYELDREETIDHLTSLYVPPYKRAETFDLSPIVEVMRRLRSPGGCPWDIAQTHESLRKHIIEEVYEVIEAIDEENAEHLCEELGDLLLQIVFHARMAEETGSFSMQDVVDGITEKLVRRHPHIFGDVSVSDAAEVLVNWEAIKKREKPERTSVLDGIPKGLPALMTAEKLQKKAADVGFDWDDIAPVWEKCAEETAELKDAVSEGDKAHIEEELGDLLFAVVNLARFLKVNPELSLMATNKKFSRRFAYVEEARAKSGKAWEDCTLAELDAFWEEAKKRGIN